MVFVGSPERYQMTNAEREERRRVLLNAPQRPVLRRQNAVILDERNHTQRRLEFEIPNRIQQEFNTPLKPARQGR